MYKRIALALLLAFMFASPAQAVLADSDTIPVSGTCTWFYEWQEDDHRFWTNKDGSKVHWRHNLHLFYCDYDDDRLDGYMVLDDNWNIFANPNKDNFSQTFTKLYSADENGNPTGLWEGTGHGAWDQGWNVVGYMVLKGIGLNKGLHAHLTMTNLSFPFPVNGELHESGQ